MLQIWPGRQHESAKNKVTHTGRCR
uniref:Uncharacterized protein n=1 Tax=Anguilla anguilla TaxID=7936 RepID=A0A0E9SPT3_ANGAN